MSYDLTFFKYQKKPRMASNKIYTTLMEGGNVPGLEELPVDDIRKMIPELFSDWTVTEGEVIDLEKDGTSFQVTFDPYYVRTDWWGDKIAEYYPEVRQQLAHRFGCHMYDAQLDVVREVIDEKTALDRVRDIRKVLNERFDKLGFKRNSLYTTGGSLETEDAVLSAGFDVYEQNRADVITVRPTFRLNYPKLNDLAREIKGKDWYASNYTASFAITDASNKAIKDPFYTLKNGENPSALIEQVMKDCGEYVFPIFKRADSIKGYEEVFLDKSVKSVRPNVAYREYYLIAMALLNRGTIEEKTLEKLLAKAEKNDDGFDPDCKDRIRKLIRKRKS